jgi:hypothetical protein
MAYKRASVAQSSEIADLGKRIDLELEKIEKAITEAGQVTPLHVEPIRPRDGHTALADGTDWDPGDGQGVYTYYNGQWNKQVSGAYQPQDDMLDDISSLTDPGADAFLVWVEANNAIEFVTASSLQASDAEIRAASAVSKYIGPARLESASAFVALTETGGAVAVDWDSFINGSVTVDENTVISNPTNGQPGTYRSILVAGNNTTDRTITFGNQYLGTVPTITDCDDTKNYLITIMCITSTWFSATAKKVLG